jgi:DNA polymerase-3 subunit delta|tara:strand:- start:952 stop:1911 length:960 start_codon:yes stop_codon:yes gene_type:complete
VIFVFYGKNDFDIDIEIHKIRMSVSPEEVRDVNTIYLNAESIVKTDFLSAVLTVPFMSNKRVVIVNGLISRINSKKIFDGSEWVDLIDQLNMLPDTTDLIFREEDLNNKNYLLKKLTDISKVRNFPILRSAELKQWIRNRADSLDITIDFQATNLMVDFIGSDLRTIDSELNKLALYSETGFITVDDVQVMVAYVKDQSIFRLVDSAIEGRHEEAMKIAKILLDYGSSPNMIIRMIQRQLRLLMIASDLRRRQVKQSEFSQRLSISGYPLQKTLEMEKRLPFLKLASIYNLILNSDLRVRSGLMSDIGSLDLLISEIAY